VVLVGLSANPLAEKFVALKAIAEHYRSWKAKMEIPD
jgi:hypothetical protein